jgi:hypothetical protein
MGERGWVDASSGRSVEMNMFGDEVACSVERVLSETELWSDCSERLNRNARTCGTGAIVSVGESDQFNTVDRCQDTGVPECKWWSSAVGIGLS